jgi:excisionase family DNA binding protein
MDAMRRTYTIEEAGEILGIGRTSAYLAARRREIPVVRIGRRLLVPHDRLEGLLRGALSHHASSTSATADS